MMRRNLALWAVLVCLLAGAGEVPDRPLAH